MTNNSIFQWLAEAFGKIYSLGDSIIIYANGNVSVSLNNFLIALAILSIILVSLLNFVKLRGNDIATTVKNQHDRNKREGRGDFGY